MKLKWCVLYVIIDTGNSKDQSLQLEMFPSIYPCSIEFEGKVGYPDESVIAVKDVKLEESACKGIKIER